MIEPISAYYEKGEPFPLSSVEQFIAAGHEEFRYLGHTFDKWKDDKGAFYQPGDDYTREDSEAKLSALWITNQYKVTYGKPEHGDIEVKCEGADVPTDTSVYFGKQIDITITEDHLWNLDKIKVNYGDKTAEFTSSPATYTLSTEDNLVITTTWTNNSGVIYYYANTEV